MLLNMIGAFVVVVKTDGLPDSFLGRYGVITDDWGEKVEVEFNKRVGNQGSLSHTAYLNDLEVIGVVK